jgi:type IV secretion system protein TrbL
MRRCIPTAILVTMPLLVIASPAHAQGALVLDTIVRQFQQQAAGWAATLTSLAQGTFFILATIELAWAGFRLAFRQADVSEWLAELVNQILFLGFFLAVLENANTWGMAIINSFRMAGRAAGGVAVDPSQVFTAGISVAQKVSAQMSFWAPAASTALLIAAIVIVLCFAYIAACMVVTLVQSYICVAAGIINMAFGGSRWTKDIAVATLRYTISVGAKLMMLQLLVSVGQNLITDWADNFTQVDNTGLFLIIGASCVLAAVVKTVPDEFQRVVGGASLASGSALIGTTAAVGAGVAGVAAGMVGAGAMAANSYRLASAQMNAADAKAEASGGQAPERSRISRAAALTGGTAKNLAMAPVRDVGRRLAGDIGSRHGVATWRMSADLANRRRLLSDDANKPLPPRSPQPPGDSSNSIS